MLPLLLVSLPQVDVIDELIERSKQVDAFSARYSVSTQGEGEPESVQTLYVHCGGRDRVRFDTEVDDVSVSAYLVDDTMVMCMRGESSSATYTRVDFDELEAELDPIEERVRDVFPTLANRMANRAGLALSWGFNEETQKCDFNLTAARVDAEWSAMGWLATLRAKRAVAVADGELLRFETDDGRFEIAVRSSSGMLEEMVSRSPGGTMHLALTELDLAPGAMDETFELPDAPAGARDMSAGMRDMMQGLDEAGLRSRYFAAIAGDSSLEWDQSLRERIEQALSPFVEHCLGRATAPTREKFSASCQRVGEWLGEAASRGADAAALQQARERELESLQTGLDKLASELIERQTKLNARLERHSNSERLRDVETQLWEARFESLVRGPLVAEFKRATGWSD